MHQKLNVLSQLKAGLLGVTTASSQRCLTTFEFTIPWQVAQGLARGSCSVNSCPA